MHKVDSSGATAQNEFTNGNPGAGIPRTVLEAKFMNTVQRELVGLPTQVGIALDDTQDNQLLQSIQLHIASIAGLMAAPKPVLPAGRTVWVHVRTYHGAASLGGGGPLWWNAGSTKTHNGGTVVKPSSVDPADPGRWERPEYECISVTEFGACAGQNSAVHTAAWRAAVVAANLSPTRTDSSSHASAATGSKPKVVVPHGTYNLDGDIASGAQLNGLVIESLGGPAIVEMADDADFITNVHYMFTMRGISVRGGATAIKVSTGNVDTVMINIEDGCEFHNQTVRVFDIDANSNSTRFLVKSSKIFNSLPDAQIMRALSGDHIMFHDCWIVAATSATGAFDMTTSVLMFEKILGVPAGGSPSTLLAWVELRGSAKFYADAGCRFGGEGSGPTKAIVINRAPADLSNPEIPTGISIQGSECYTSGALVYLYAIPNFIDIRGVSGLVESDPIKIDAAVDPADLAAIGGLHHRFIVEFNSQQYTLNADAPVIAREGLPLVHDRCVLSARPQVADLVYQSQGNTGAYSPAVVQSNFTLTTPNDEFGVPSRHNVATDPANNLTLDYLTALDTLAAGVYTAVFSVEVLTDHSIRPHFVASNSREWSKVLARGRHTICVPFYYDAGSAKTIGLHIFNAPDGATFQWSRWKIFKGRVFAATKRLELDGTAAPAGQAYRGDVMWYIAPAASGKIGSTCVTAGNPGTWKDFGAIDA